MRVSKIDEPVPNFSNWKRAGVGSSRIVLVKHHERQEAVNELRESMARSGPT